jgi:hypothetical protein
VLVLPHLAFDLEPAERRFLDVRWSDARAKNISLDGSSIRGARGDPADLAALARMIERFASSASALVAALFPRYAPHLQRERTSFRPHGAAARTVSWRKDDTRLHLDAFPTSPTRGARILRVFSNVNPEGRPRTWRVGEDAEQVSERFARELSVPMPGVHLVLAALRITKQVRTPYDALMLQLHDRMKQDESYQSSSPQEQVDLPAGSTWLTFTDQVSHAAMAGQYQFEQTFLVPVSAMLDEHRSPLRILERIKGRRLA